MTKRTGVTIARQALLMTAGALLLAGCGTQETTASNAVQQRDMDVEDGTINDSMTDLDAVSSSGVGGGNSGSNEASETRKATTTPDEVAGDAEAVPSE
jgi:hypothetical protein